MVIAVEEALWKPKQCSMRRRKEKQSTGSGNDSAETIPVEAHVHVDVGDRDGLVGERDGGIDKLIGMAAIAPGDGETVMNEPAKWVVGAERENEEREDREMGLDAGKDDSRRNEEREDPEHEADRPAQDAPKVKPIEVKRVFKGKSSSE